MNVLHVPTITKNLVSVGQIVDQGMQVWFTHLGCFIEEEGQVIVQGRRDGRMFILDTSDGGTAMFAKGQKRCRVITRVRGEIGGTTGVLDRGIGEKRERERERETLTHVWTKKHTGKRPGNTKDTS